MEKQHSKFNQRTYSNVKAELSTSAIRSIGIRDPIEIEKMQKQFEEWDKLLAAGKPVIWQSNTGGTVVASNQLFDTDNLVDISTIRVDTILEKPDRIADDILPESLEEMDIEVVLEEREIEVVEKKSSVDSVAVKKDSLLSFDTVLTANAQSVAIDTQLTIPVDNASPEQVMDDPELLPIAAEPRAPQSAHLPYIVIANHTESDPRCVILPGASPAKKSILEARKFSITSISIVNGKRYLVTYNSSCRYLFVTPHDPGIYRISSQSEEYVNKLDPGEFLVWIENG